MDYPFPMEKKKKLSSTRRDLQFGISTFLKIQKKFQIFCGKNQKKSKPAKISQKRPLKPTCVHFWHLRTSTAPQNYFTASRFTHMWSFDNKKSAPKPSIILKNSDQQRRRRKNFFHRITIFYKFLLFYKFYLKTVLLILLQI